MSREQRFEGAMALIRDPEFRVPVVQICRALDVPRSTVERHLHAPCAAGRCDELLAAGQRPGDEDMIRRCTELRLAHPFWGYRRMWAHIRYRQGIVVSRNRIYRIMRENGLLLDRKRMKPVRPWRPKIRAERSNQYWGTDMSKFMIPGFGWLYFVVVIDWFTKMILGLSVGGRGDTSLWLHALSDAGLKAFPEDGVRGKGVHLISDNGSQPTSKRYMAECVHLDIEQIFTTYDNPRGNADTERVIRTLKEEAVWPYEHETPMAAEAKLRETVEFYNTVYCHSSLGYLSPAEFAAAFFSNVGKTMVGINGVENNAPGFNMSNDLGSDEGDGPPLSPEITTTEVAA